MRIIYCADFSNTMGGKKLADEHHLAEAFEEIGHTVHRESFYKTRGVGKIMKRPDVILFGKLHLPHRFFNNVIHQYRGTKKVGHHFENMYEPDQSSLATQRKHLWISQQGVFDSTISCVNIDERDWGAKRWDLVHACFKDYELGEAPEVKERLLFVGKMNKTREILINRIRREVPVDFVDNVFNEKLAELVRSYRLVLNHSSWAELDFTWNDRTYIVPGNGGLLLTNYCRGLHTQGKIGEHFLTYQDDDDALTEIELVFSDPKKYDRVRVASREHFLKHHTFRNRAERFVEIFKGLM